MSTTLPRFSHARLIHLQDADGCHHFDMHEDITETRCHLMTEHCVTPVIGQGAYGQGAAAELAHQHEALHQGAVPVIGPAALADVISYAQHLAQAHGGATFAHAVAHLHGHFVPGQEHYHSAGK
jgi:hypothetical protein